jgi:DNA-binding CsgD family transcriptional regulator
MIAAPFGSNDASTTQKHLPKEQQAHIFKELLKGAKITRLKTVSIFTPREIDILVLLLNPRITNALVAEHLVISPKTLENHLTSIYAKLGAPGCGPRVAVQLFVHEHPEYLADLLRFYLAPERPAA